ncbi:unnamed protein product [Durusdinium trenchii]|uniref:Ion transport domain-containing protein n=1 Tax=Durusdinium trenchii TaxID=1381693 RepID=A0ABP0MAZ9_9DINO
MALAEAPPLSRESSLSKASPKLRSKASGLLDVRHSPKWLQLDRVHGDFVRSHKKHAEAWILSAEGHLFMGAIIAFQSLVLGAEVSLELEVEETWLKRWAIGLLFLDVLFLFIFFVEYILRSHALRMQYVLSASGLFDLLLLVTGLFAALVAFLDLLELPLPELLLGVAKSIRRLRILRIGRVFAIFPALSLLIKGLIRTQVAIVDSAVLICMMSLMGALLCAEELGHSEEGKELFGSVLQSFFVHLQLVLIEAWPDIAEVMMRSSKFWAVYVVLFLMVSSFAVLNVVTAIVCDGVLDLAQGQPPKSLDQVHAQHRAFRDQASDLYSTAKKGRKGELESKNCGSLLQTLDGKALLKKMHIALPSERQMRGLVDPDASGTVSLEELQEGLMRLRESHTDLMSLGTQCVLHRRIRSNLAALYQAEQTIEQKLRTQSDVTTARLRTVMDQLEVAWTELVSMPSRQGAAEEEELYKALQGMRRLEEVLGCLEQTMLNTINVSYTEKQSFQSTAVQTLHTAPPTMTVPVTPPTRLPPMPKRVTERRWGRAQTQEVLQKDWSTHLL